jgi:phytoene dehydrogenase-like protein
VAVVGAAGPGWPRRALVQAGHRVTLFEMAPQWGGRARGVDVDGWRWTTASTS